MKLSLTNRWKDKESFLLLLLMVLGGFFRIYRLGEPAFRADTIHFFSLCSRPGSASAFFSHWIEWMGICGQFPFPMAWIKGFLNLLNLDPTPFNIRFPSALWGILTIPAAYLVGRTLCGKRVGWLFSSLMAFQPLLIQATREAYYYPPLLLGSVLLLAGLAGISCGLSSGRAWSRWVYVVYPIGFLLTIYSQPSGWSLALLHVLIPFVAWLWLWLRRRQFCMPLFMLLLICGIIGLPMLFADWGLPAMRQTTSAPMREYARRVFGEAGSYPVFFFKSLLSYGWGETPVRIGLTLLVLAASVFGLGVGVRRQRWLWVFPYLLVGGALLFIFGQLSSGAGLAPRYLIAYAPVYLLFLAVGMDQLFVWLESVRRVSNFTGPCLFTLGIVLIAAFLPAAWMSTQLTGQPTPYKDIVRWMDTQLPSGTPVLVDRWFEPWNELKIYNSTNVFFTFTVPNEPADVYTKVHWRETAKQFFERYPDAAYMEIAKSYWENPAIGPWDWPRQYFKRHAVIRNEAGLKLRNLGLLYREDGGIYTNRLIVEIFYNTREDILSNAKADGRTLVSLYGNGWRYTKTQDYRDWRVLEGAANFDLYNLTDSPMAVEVKIRAVAPSGSKKVRVSNGSEHIFAGGQFVEWDIGRLTLAPGQNTIQLTDSLWSMAGVPLIVDGFDVSAVQPEAVAGTSVIPEVPR